MRCSLVREFIIPPYINSSTCFERYVAHHQELQLYLQLLVYIRLWGPPVVPSEWELAKPVPTQTAPRAVSTSVCKPEAASTVEVPDDERHNARNMLNY